jgi:small subunit ribosomal protein S4
MARYTGPRVRISRRFGVPIFGPSKYLERRNYGPGMHGPKSRRKVTDYALGLIEKQKLRYYYGLMERQFRACTRRPRSAGVTGEPCCRSSRRGWTTWCTTWGFGHTRPPPPDGGPRPRPGERPQGQRPSYALRVNDVVEVRNTSVSRQLATKNLEISTSRAVPDWLS